MIKILSDHAKNGWKLHTMYSNELGKSALMILGFGTNSTACEDVLIFERRLPDLNEMIKSLGKKEQTITMIKILFVCHGTTAEHGSQSE